MQGQSQTPQTHLSSQFQLLCTLENSGLTIKSRICNQNGPLQLRIFHTVSLTRTDIYQAQLHQLKPNTIISQMFDNLSEVQNFIRDPDNLQVNIQKLQLIILMKQKVKNIKLAQMELSLIQRNKKQDGLVKTDQECIETIIAQLEAREDVRKTMKMLTEIVGKLVTERKEHNEFKIKMETQMKELKNKNQQLAQKFAQVSQKQVVNSENQGKINVLNMGSSQSLEDSRKEVTLNEGDLQQLRQQIHTLKEEVMKIKKGSSKIYQKIQQSNFYASDSMTTANPMTKNEDMKNTSKQQQSKDSSKQDQMMQMIERLQQKLISFAQETEKRFDQQGQSLQYFEKVADELKKSAPSPISAMTWIDPSCFYFRKVRIQQNSITALDTSWLIGTKQIKEKYSFSFTINRMKQNLVFGIVDQRQKFKNQWTTNKVLAYWSYGRFRFEETTINKAGDKIFRGECTTVTIDPVVGLFQVRSGNTLKFKFDIGSIFKDKSVVFVPFIGLNDKNDKISLSA